MIGAGEWPITGWAGSIPSSGLPPAHSGSIAEHLQPFAQSSCIRKRTDIRLHCRSAATGGYQTNPTAAGDGDLSQTPRPTSEPLTCRSPTTDRPMRRVAGRHGTTSGSQPRRSLPWYCENRSRECVRRRPQKSRSAGSGHCGPPSCASRQTAQKPKRWLCVGSLVVTFRQVIKATRCTSLVLRPLPPNGHRSTPTTRARDEFPPLSIEYSIGRRSGSVGRNGIPRACSFDIVVSENCTAC